MYVAELAADEADCSVCTIASNRTTKNLLRNRTSLRHGAFMGSACQGGCGGDEAPRTVEFGIRLISVWAKSPQKIASI